MKKIKIFSLLAALLLSTTGYAQIKVENNGRVIVGPSNNYTAGGGKLRLIGDWDSNYQLYNGTTLQFGAVPDKMYIGSSGYEAGGVLAIHASTAIVFSTDSGTSMEYLSWLGKYKVYANQTEVNNLTCSSLSYLSDERLKKNISPLSNSLSQLAKLKAISYELDLSKSSYNEPDEIDVTGYGKTTRDVAALPVDTRKHMGFSAQELQKIFPDLVTTRKDGILSVDYIGLIPVIVEAMKEQNAVIEAQSKKIAELAGDAGANVLLPGSSQARSLAVQGQNEAIAADAAANAFLYQNEPNPFNQSTQIRYFLPTEVQSAFIYLFNMQGALIKSLAADAVGSLTIEAAELAPGMYIYSLIADGKEVDSKRMIVTE